MRIIQLTDLHLPPTGIETQLGIDTRRNFLDMLPRAAALHPDLLVLSGDICYDVGDMATYVWVREKMDALDIPYAVIAGNHDDPAWLASAFGLSIQQKEGYYVRQVGQQPVLFLDTALATISDVQLAWLETQLSKQHGPVLLFMHHPPLLIGMPFIDAHWPFQRSADLMAVLTRYPAPVHVFCGHYHVERVVHDRNVSVHVTPSLYFQLDAEADEFIVDHTRIALRVIDFKEDRLFTAVQYFDGHKI